MAKQEHLDKIGEGVERWNEWRKSAGAFVDLAAADLSRKDLSGANLWKVKLSGADLRNTKLNGTNLSGANLNGANLIWAKMAGAKLGWAELYNADLSDADLTGADLRRASLNKALLIKANLSNANLDSAMLADSNLKWANLNGANFNQTRIFGTNLTGAKFAEADLNKAQLHNAVFADVDLSRAKGLTTCTHSGPCTVGVDTLFRSGGAIPEVFLRGCGVPERLIIYARSLLGQAIEFRSCFISYSSQDQAFADRLHADLRAKDLRCWFAPEDLKIGDRFEEEIEKSIHLYDKVMIVLSEASVQSRWVEREFQAAREREEREKRTVLFPIRIDDAVMHATQPWAADIRRSRHIGDFRGWGDHAAYLKAFTRLLRDLTAESGAAGQQA